MSGVLKAAISVAREAHRGQVDKGGYPYIDHPARVEHTLVEQGFGETHRVVAWLHDTVEDSGVTLAALRNQFPVEVVEAVDAITHRPGESRDDYYQRVLANEIALPVKRADIKDNIDPQRLVVLDAQTRDRLVAKYEHALSVLG